MIDIIRKIEEVANIYFLESKFKLRALSNNSFRIEGDSFAVNNVRNDKQQIKVLKWFKNFWIFFEIKIIEKGNYPNIFLTISVFEGENSDNHKIQLFRAEWDNYENNLEHPQPHWHIYPFNSFEEYDTFKELVSEASTQEGFSNFITDSSKVVDLSKFHFAMNGQWYYEKGHVSKIDNDNSLINWISGVFGHIKYQLNYIN